MLLGAAALGYVGIAVFALRKLTGWRLWGALLLGLAAARVCYVPVVATSMLLCGWAEWIGRAVGASRLAGPLHYALPCFVAALTALTALLALAAASHLKQIGWVMVLVLFGGLGTLAFWHESDRITPHPFLSEAPPPATRGPDYFDVVEDGERHVVTRILAAGGLIRHAVSARSTWSGAIRSELLARYRGSPDMTLGERMKCLEAALVSSRPLLGTSPRSPR